MLQNFQFQSLSSGPIAVIFIYGILILGFGCCIFRGIERVSSHFRKKIPIHSRNSLLFQEHLRTLKVSVGGCTLLQCLVLVTHLVLISLTFDTLTEEDRMSQVAVLAVNLVLTFLTLTTHFLYMIRLARAQWMVLRGGESLSHGSGSSLPLSATAASLTLKAGSGCGSGGEGGRSSVGSCSTATPTRNLAMTGFNTPQRYVDGQWENLHV